ncbi:MAG TPA: glycosyltransferase, partial [Candidatus Ozemobacteraceae bacterium]|nr:glycosyltransferase [Candidatus Ozemobacteraceae bacterium]
EEQLAQLSAQLADPACRRLVLFPHAREDRFHLFHPMLQAVQLAEASLRRYRLMFVGVNDESRQAINTLPKSLRSHCEMRKQISHDDVYDLLGGSRVVVKPSISDGTPNIMLEAMATGTLPILSPIESIQEWLADGVNGLLAANDDPEALADAMARACEDDVFVRDAASMNSGLIEARADRRGVRKQVLAMYESLWSGEEDPETSRASKELFSEAESCVSW